MTNQSLQKFFFSFFSKSNFFEYSKFSANQDIIFDLLQEMFFLFRFNLVRSSKDEIDDGGGDDGRDGEESEYLPAEDLVDTGDAPNDLDVQLEHLNALVLK
jgi:hypothetical protein